MPLVGEWASRVWASSTSQLGHTASWDIDIPPRAAFVKVFMGHIIDWSFGNVAAVQIGLLNIRFRDQNGVDQTITFPDLDEFEKVAVAYNDTLTHVTFGMRVIDASGSAVLTLGFWD